MQPFTPIERLFTARVQPGYGDGKGHNHGENSNAAQIYPSPPGGLGRSRLHDPNPLRRLRTHETAKLRIKVRLQP